MLCFHAPNTGVLIYASNTSNNILFKNSTKLAKAATIKCHINNPSVEWSVEEVMIIIKNSLIPVWNDLQFRGGNNLKHVYISSDED